MTGFFQRLFLTLISAFFVPLIGHAQVQDPVKILYELLRIDEALEIMNEEGIAASSDIAFEFFGDVTPEGWEGDIRKIYSDAPTQDSFRTGFEDFLKDADVEEVMLFLESDTGARIIELELSARRALMDDDVEGLSESNMESARAMGTDRFDQINAFIQANDLVEFNVQGALNANLAFMLGLQDGQPIQDRFAEDELLSLVWSQEHEIRLETEDWLLSYLLLAYDPLQDTDLDAYIALSETPSGRRVNAAIFHAFDIVFIQQSRMLGQTIGYYMTGSDI